MRRKLIKLEAFEQITNNSAENAEYELKSAEDFLAEALGENQLSLTNFNETTVLYETSDETYVHAGYKIDKNAITFDNIEELVVDHDSKKSKQKLALAEMVDAVLADDLDKANEMFNGYMSLYSFNEAKKTVFKASGKATVKGKKDKKEKKLPPWLQGKFDKMAKKEKKKGPSSEKKEKVMKSLKKAGKLKEAYQTAANVLDYVDFLNFGPVMVETKTHSDDKGNVTHVKLPVAAQRNKGRVLSFNWKTLNGKVQTLRSDAQGLSENQNFVKAVSDLRRQNRLSNNQGIMETLENIVQAWPNLLYVTQNELSNMISEALETSGNQNYDDKDCEFMAEGILRTAFDSYQEKVNQILHLAGTKSNKASYEQFQEVAENFYAQVDEKFGVEKNIFNDLYEGASAIFNYASRANDSQLKNVSANFARDLADIVEEKAHTDLELAEGVASWIVNLIETNLETGVWNVSNTPFVSVDGDHPQMAKWAAHSYSPAKDASGSMGDEIAQIGADNNDYKSGKNSKKTRSSGWGNIGGKNTFPTLSNPYAPKPFGDYTMKGEKGVDKEGTGQYNGTWQGKDTWPNLQNPYIPSFETAKSYKINKGKEVDALVDM